MSDTAFVVVKVPAEEYFARTGGFAVAVALADEHGARRTGGGTCLTTEVSDIDFDVPTAHLAGLLAALDAAGLPYRASAREAD